MLANAVPEIDVVPSDRGALSSLFRAGMPRLKAIGLYIPANVVGLADEVVE
jgi:hypothetical protein